MSSSQACNRSQKDGTKRMSKSLQNGSRDVYCVLMTKVQFMLCPTLLTTWHLRVQHRSQPACLGPTGSHDEPASNSQSEIPSYTIKQRWKLPCKAHTHVFVFTNNRACYWQEFGCQNKSKHRYNVIGGNV